MGFNHMGIGMLINIRKYVNGSPILKLEDIVDNIYLQFYGKYGRDIYISNHLLRYFSRTYQQNVIPFYNSFLGAKMEHDIDIDKMVNLSGIDSFVMRVEFKDNVIKYANGYSSDEESYLFDCYILNANVFNEELNKRPVLFSG